MRRPFTELVGFFAPKRNDGSRTALAMIASGCLSLVILLIVSESANGVAALLEKNPQAEVSAQGAWDLRFKLGISGVLLAFFGTSFLVPRSIMGRTQIWQGESGADSAERLEKHG